jgi:F-type H+-transporting ATPase subunit epsilon
MPDLLQLEVATPERLMVSEQVADVQVPGKEGYMGILPGHAALLSELGEGVLTYSVSGRKRSLMLHGGFVEVLDNHVRVLADRAEESTEPRP